MSMTVLIPLAIYLASGLLNWALAFKSPEEWATYAERYPAGARVRKALRKVGLDLPGLLRLAQNALAARAKLPSAPGSAPSASGVGK